MIGAVFVLPALTFGLLRFPDSKEAFWIHNLYARKLCALAKRHEGGSNVLITVGGSGGLFGIDAERIERELQIPTVNLNTHGGLGLSYFISRAQRSARRGDTILFSVEHELFHVDPAEENSILKKYVWTYDRKYLSMLPPREALAAVFLNPISDYFTALHQLRIDSPKFESPYTFVELSSNGDMRGNVAELAFAVNSPPPDVDRNVASRLRSFKKWANQHGIRLLFSWPAVARGSDEVEAGRLILFQHIEAVLASSGIDILDDAAGSEYPPECFIDSKYHLKDSIRVIHTERLVSRLRIAFSKPASDNVQPSLCLIRSRSFFGTPWHSSRKLDLDASRFEYRYLSDRPDRCRDVISVDAVKGALRSGRVVFAADEEAASLLERAGLTVERSESSESIQEWLRKHESELRIATVFSPGEEPVPREAVPEELEELAFPGSSGNDAYRAAFLYPGHPPAVRRSGDPFDWLERITPSCSGIPQMGARVTSRPSGGEGAQASPIRISNAHPCDASPGFKAVAIDLRLGIITDAISTANGEIRLPKPMKVSEGSEPPHAVQ